MAWTVIPTTDIDQDSPVTQPLMVGIRDNIILANNFIATDDLNAPTADFTLSATDYDGYMFILANVTPDTDSVNLLFRTSTDGGTSYDSGASDYAWSATSVVLGGSSPTESGATASAIQLNGSSSSMGSAAGEDGFSGTLWLPGPHLAKKTYAQWSGGFTNAAGSEVGVRGAGFRDSQGDVDAVRFVFSSGNLESGTITMYGFMNQGDS